MKPKKKQTRGQSALGEEIKCGLKHKQICIMMIKKIMMTKGPGPHNNNKEKMSECVSKA